MSLTEQKIDLVQSSFRQVAPIADQAAEMFYARLFEIAPEVRPMFKGDMAEQGKKLMAVLAAVVNGLRDLDRIVPVAERLAVGHLEYGVRPEHYRTVGEALLWTLGEAFGDDFTPDLHEAWGSAYTTLSSAMIAAAYRDAKAA